jgi:cell division protein FtsX
MKLRAIYGVAASVHALAFVIWCFMPVQHEYVPSGYRPYDAVILPVAAITLLVMVVAGIGGMFMREP